MSEWDLDRKRVAKVGSWGFYNWPIEPPYMSDEEWWAREAEFAAEDDAVPTYDELMAREDSGYLGSEVV